MPKQKVVLVNDLSPGDVLIMSVAVRSLYKAHGDKYEIDVRSPSQEIYLNSPYITKIVPADNRKERAAIEELKKDETHPPIEVDGVKYVISHYPEIHRSSMTGLPFADGHRMFLERQLNIAIPRTGMRPDIFLSPFELSLPRQVDGAYWIINAGIKNDYTLKWYAHYQEVVDLLKDKITFVQVGHANHNHPPLDGVIDLRGKTTLRQLFTLSHYAHGAICAVSLQMVIMAALGKPCVVISGAREGTRWQLNPDHRFLYMTGAMKCATYDGCWKSKKEDCVFKAPNGEPMCMELIRPEDVARAVELYYLGGRLQYDKTEPVILDLEKENPLDKILDSKEMGKAAQATVAKIFNDVTSSNTEPMPESMHPIQIDSAIFNTLRILKKICPTDTYLEAYQWHYAKRGESFMDTYHYMWYLGAVVKPKRILEIGTRTGLSIAQLLSAFLDHSNIQEIILCDLFNDGLCTPNLVLNNLRYLNLPTDKISFITGDSLVEIPKLFGTKMFDYILVDGGHDKENARQDLHNATQLIDRGGHIVFDDITPDGCNLQDVWDEFKNIHFHEFHYYENHDGKGIGVAVRL